MPQADPQLLDCLSVLLTQRELDAAPRTHSELASWVSQRTRLPPELIAQAEQKGSLEIGAYTITGRLGSGGMGAVLRAKHRDTATEVAIKLLHTDANDVTRARFAREAMALARLDHPNIVRLIGYESDPLPYLVIELVPGVSLERRLRKSGPIAEGDAWVLLEQTSASLRAAEEAGIQHRDVKPGNILWVPETGTYKVCDFGIARLHQGGEQLTVQGTTLGTPAYMSPEQAVGKELDSRCDMYSLGLTLHELLTGEIPFDGGPIGVVLTRRVDEDVPSLRSVLKGTSRALSSLVASLTKRDREERPPNWNVFCQRLAKEAEGVRGAETRPHTVPEVAEFDPTDDSRAFDPPAAPVPMTRAPVVLPGSSTGPIPPMRTMREPAIGEVLGDYRLDGVIGRGGMGVVYRATKLKTKKPYAVKAVIVGQGPEGTRRRERFKKEVEALRRLDHENLVRVYTYGRKDPHDWYAMDLIEGRGLDEVLRDTTSSRLDRYQKLTLFVSVCNAITHAHEHNVIHRDLKPSNVLVDTRGRPYVLDFGLAKITDETKQGLTRTGSFLGTPYYMAPEQFLDPKNIDSRIDVFSLGVLLYEMLTGKRPFEGETSGEISYKIMREDPVRPSKANPNIDRALDAVLLKALAKDPERRHQSVALFKRDVVRFRRGSIQAESFGQRLWGRFTRWLYDHRVGLIAGFLLATLIYGLTAFLLYRWLY